MMSKLPPIKRPTFRLTLWKIYVFEKKQQYWLKLTSAVSLFGGGTFQRNQYRLRCKSLTNSLQLKGPMCDNDDEYLCIIIRNVFGRMFCA